MEIETLKEMPYSLNEGWSQPHQSAAYDLTSLIGKMKQSNSWERGELNNIVLLNKPGKQIILTALHKRTEIESFQESDSISFQIIEGELRFRTRNESLLLKEGQLLTLHEKVNYSLTTNAETVFLLTILNQTSNLRIAK
jgi:hypothetical protein